MYYSKALWKHRIQMKSNVRTEVKVTLDFLLTWFCGWHRVYTVNPRHRGNTASQLSPCVDTLSAPQQYFFIDMVSPVAPCLYNQTSGTRGNTSSQLSPCVDSFCIRELYMYTLADVVIALPPRKLSLRPVLGVSTTTRRLWVKFRDVENQDKRESSGGGGWAFWCVFTEVWSGAYPIRLANLLSTTTTQIPTSLYHNGSYWSF